MTRRLLIGLLCLLCTKCAENPVATPPDDLIKREPFTRILADLSMIEAIKGMQTSKETDGKVELEALYADIWEREGVTEEQFTTSYSYYGNDLQGMSDMQTAAAVIIKKREDTLLRKKREAAAASK